MISWFQSLLSQMGRLACRYAPVEGSIEILRGGALHVESS
jgi:hypothetical protein